MRPEGAAEVLVADGLPAEAAGLMSTRVGGVSEAPFDGLNLRPSVLGGERTDRPAAVAENQRRFAALLDGAVPVWLDQVHGTRVVRLQARDARPSDGALPQQADASITTERGVACTVLVADCLPVLLAAPDGRGVGAAHAGWRGLAGGVLDNTVAALCDAAGCEPRELVAWLGACIGPRHFEVGDDVRDAFGEAGHRHFLPTGVAGKWWADLPALARQRLRAAGVAAAQGGTWCTYGEPLRFFSYRRDRVTGRQAAAVWLR